MARALSSLVALLFVLTDTSGTIGGGGLRLMAALDLFLEITQVEHVI